MTILDGPEKPKENFLWQDPIPVSKTPIISAKQIESLKTKILKSGFKNES